jgi:hypothetical protein
MSGLKSGISLRIFPATCWRMTSNQSILGATNAQIAFTQIPSYEYRAGTAM